MRRLAILLLATSVLSSCRADTGDPPGGYVPSPTTTGAPGEVVVVVGDAEDPEEGDVLLRDHLRTALALPVRFARHDEAADLEGVALLVVSPSATSADVADGYRDVALPVLVLEDEVFDDMALAAGAGEAADQEQLDFEAAALETSGGFAEGDRAVVRDGTTFAHAVDLAPGAQTLARLVDDADAAVWFRIERGSELTDGNAPARRVGLGLDPQAYGNLVAGGWDVLDASVAWLLGRVPPPRDRVALVLVGNDGVPLDAEWMVRSRLRDSGFDVVLVRDEELEGTDVDAFDLVVMSKSVESTVVGTALKGVARPVLFWEDNQQRLSMLATIDDDGEEGTSWHATGREVHLDDGAPADLRGGLSGTVAWYVDEDEITFAPAGTLGDDAIVVATFGGDGGDRPALYVYDEEATLADGTAAAGRRGYFGLYDETYRLLTLDGVALFDGMVAWATRPEEDGGD